MSSAKNISTSSQNRTEELFHEHQQSIYIQTDRLFAKLLAFEYIVGIAAAVWISPLTWTGTNSETHIHVWTAIFLGGLIVSLPIILAVFIPGRTITRHTIAIAQMFFSAMLIHLSGGRIETHFHVFGSLAFLAFYRDWRVLLTATLVVGLEHFARSIFWPQSVFGVLAASPWRAVEHIGWVLFEDIFLILSCLQGTNEMQQIAKRQAKLESTNELIETEVHERTAELAEANIQLIREQYLLNTFVETIPDPVFFKDREGRFIRVNQAMATQNGFNSPYDMLGKTDADIWDGDFPKETFQDEQRILITGEPLINKEEQPSLSSNNPLWVLVTKMALRNEAGDIVGILGVGREITKIKLQQQEIERINIELLKARDAAEKANYAKSEFLANMSHEIRTPMNAIIGLTDLVLDTELNTTQYEYLKIVLESAESLLCIINGILDFSKIEAGKLELENIDFNLQDHVGDTLKSLSQRAYEKKLELAWHVHSNVPDWLSGDPGRLRQMLVNLIGNAIKFTEKGEVLVDIQCDHIQGNAITLHISVRDTGIGIPEEKQESIFSKFEQVDSSTTRQFGGTGLGLTITTRIAESMGGRVWVESTPSKGSTFHFTAIFNKANAPHPETKNLTDLVGIPVMIVDDNKTNRLILEEILQSWGMIVSTADSALNAISELNQTIEQKKKIPLLISDINMPIMDGFDLVKKLRSIEPLSDITVILLSSSNRSGDIDRSNNLEINANLMKPVKQSELLETIMSIACRQPQNEHDEPSFIYEDDISVSPLNILLTEDSKANQVLATSLLTQWGHHVEIAQNGKEAISKWKAGNFDIILMDVQMPIMDGLDATRQIRKLEKEDQHIPIIAMTARAMKTDRQCCKEAGMDDYISKPIRRSKLTLALLNFGIKKHPSNNEPRNNPTIDWHKALKTAGGDSNLLNEIFVTFLQEVQDLYPQLKESIKDKDFKTAERLVHTIKGAASTVAAIPMMNAASTIEEFLSKNDLESAILQMPHLEKQIKKLSGMSPDSRKNQ